MPAETLIAGDNMTMPFRFGAMAALIFGVLGSAGAETTTDRYGKELKIEPSRYMFARFGLLNLKINNKSEAAKDITGPVLSRGARGQGCPLRSDPADSTGDTDLPRCDPAGQPGPYESIYDGTGNIANILFGGTGVDSLGIPDDVRARIADPLPGGIGTIGMYFDEDKKWAVEVPVMALPFDIDIYGAGAFQQAGKIITGKTLGFLVFGHYYFGQKNDKFRPSVSLTANYLVPFNMRATSALEQWTGGVTKVSSKASLGMGWMVGGKYAINESWDVNVNFGQFKAKVDSYLTTYDTLFNARRSPIFQYWPGRLGQNISGLVNDGNLQTQLTQLMAYRNYAVENRVNGGANLGNFTRKQTQTLDPYVLLMTVGYNF